MTQELLTPQKLFDYFKMDPSDLEWEDRDEAFTSFSLLDDKSPFLQPTITFMKDRKRTDEVRQFGPQILSWMKGNDAKKAFDSLLSMFRSENTPDLKKEFVWTRFRALYALGHLAEYSKNGAMKEKLVELANEIAYDSKEEYDNQAIGLLLIAKFSADESKRDNAIETIRNMLSKEGLGGNANSKGDFWTAQSALNALKEVPLSDVRYKIVDVMKQSPNYEDKTEAIRALGCYEKDEHIADELGSVVRTNRDRHLRWQATVSLGRLHCPQAADYVIKAVTDINEEVRHQAVKALLEISGDPAIALRTISQEALKENVPKNDFDNYVAALREIDRLD